MEPSYLRRTLEYEKNLRKRYGDTFVDLGLQEFAPRLSKADIQYLRRLMQRRAYGVEEALTFQLGENYPEPFNPTTAIPYTLYGDQASRVSLQVFNLNGQLIRTLVNSVQNPGSHTTFWNGADESGRRVASGVYFYRLESGGVSLSKRMILAK